MKPFKLELRNPEFGVVVHCKHNFGFVTKSYYLSVSESTKDKAVWCNCKTGQIVKDKGLSAYIMMHLLDRIRAYYSSHNFG